MDSDFWLGFEARTSRAGRKGQAGLCADRRSNGGLGQRQLVYDRTARPGFLPWKRSYHADSRRVGDRFWQVRPFL